MKNTKYTRDGVNQNTFNLLFDEKSIKKGKKECSKEIRTIELSSIHEKKFILKLYYPLTRLLRMYQNDVNYFNIHKKIFARGYVFKNRNIKFEFDYLEKHLRNILKNEDPYVKKELLWNMKNNFRYGSCYSVNMIISQNIKDSYLVTGLIPFEDGIKHKHAYVEYKDYVIDYTKNLIIKKEKYYELLKVQELGKIKSEDIPMVFNLLLENGILNTDRYMATFGNEIVEDLMKNKELLKMPTSDKPDFSILYM